MLQKARDMFTFGYDSYMTFAFPMDELDPIHCKGLFFLGDVYLDYLTNLNASDIISF